MIADSTNLVLLLLACGCLVTALYAHACWLRRREGSTADRQVHAETPPETPGVFWWQRAVTIAVLGIGLALLMPIATALHAGNPDVPNRAEGFVHTLVFSGPIVLCVFYLRRSGRPGRCETIMLTAFVILFLGIPVAVGLLITVEEYAAEGGPISRRRPVRRLQTAFGSGLLSDREPASVNWGRAAALCVDSRTLGGMIARCVTPGRPSGGIAIWLVSYAAD